MSPDFGPVAVCGGILGATMPDLMRTLRLPVILLVLALPLAARAEEGTVVRGTLGAKLDRTVQRTTGGGFWGCVLGAHKGEVLLAKGYGFADYCGSRGN